MLAHKRHVSRNIERKSMHRATISRPTAHPHTDCANLAGILGVWIYPNTRELAHAPSVVHSKLGQRVNHQLLNVIYIGASVGRAVDSVLGPQTQNGVTNQLTRSVIRNVSTPLHFNEICTDISWRTAQVICQVGGVSVGENVWVLKQQQVLIQPMLKQSRLQSKCLAIWHTTNPPDMKWCR